MHEYAVTKNMLAVALEEAEKAGAKKIIEIRLVIGDLSTIIDESVQMYFDFLTEETIADGAKLVFKRVPAVFQCKACSIEFNKPAKGFDCPQCGAMGAPTGVGREFYIESIEVE
ncbi:MAG: hydrogenase maturation nickel metallochaperone HypA [Clostridia bacterium]|nr:hydrogenase maturation nickel metallochaperone HypA [Clostridia bacterium]